LPSSAFSSASRSRGLRIMSSSNVHGAMIVDRPA
jgi:hypothetical protein